MASSAHSKNSQITSRVPRTTHTQIHNPREHTITYEHICFVYGYIQYVQTTLVEARGASKMRRRTEKRTKAQVLCWIAFERVVFYDYSTYVCMDVNMWTRFVPRVLMRVSSWWCVPCCSTICSVRAHMFYVHTCTTRHTHIARDSR